MTDNGKSPVLVPVRVAIPEHGVVFAESVHAGRFRMEMRHDPFAKIVYVVRGRVLLEREGRESIEGGGSTFFVVDENQRHCFRDLDPSTLFLLGMKPEFVRGNPVRNELWQAVRAGSGRSVRFGKSAPNPGFERLWRVALLEQNTQPAGYPLQVCSCADQILVFLARWRQTPHRGSASERVAGVLREMETGFHDQWNIERACGRAGLSRHYFTKIFRQLTGLSFLEKLTALRLEHAALLLRRGGHSIAGVAFACGFSDISHFYRVFHARFGEPPGRWQVLKGEKDSAKIPIAHSGKSRKITDQ